MDRVPDDVRKLVIEKTLGLGEPGKKQVENTSNSSGISVNFKDSEVSHIRTNESKSLADLLQETLDRRVQQEDKKLEEQKAIRQKIAEKSRIDIVGKLLGGFNRRQI